MPLRNLRPDLNGVIVVDKPIGWTSTRICSEIRRRTGRAKVGHAGTLDPLASGVLVVCLGTATKSIARFMDGQKEYLAEIDLSATSISDDLESPRQPVEVAAPPTHAEVAAALAAHFVGTIRQTPPTFSAIQQGGKRAYHAARAGTPFEMQSREVTIHEARLESYAWPIARIWIRCGKGVYIRSIARDLGRALGVGGMLTALQRTRVGWQGIIGSRDSSLGFEAREASAIVRLAKHGNSTARRARHRHRPAVARRASHQLSSRSSLTLVGHWGTNRCHSCSRAYWSILCTSPFTACWHTLYITLPHSRTDCPPSRARANVDVTSLEVNQSKAGGGRQRLG
jgi:tRNA pseudouridine55 synthase